MTKIPFSPDQLAFGEPESFPAFDEPRTIRRARATLANNLSISVIADIEPEAYELGLGKTTGENTNTRCVKFFSTRIELDIYIAGLATRTEAEIDAFLTYASKHEE